VARRQLVSIRLELRTLLYAGVLLLTTGVGLFVKENHDRIGPAAIAAGIGFAAALCFGYVARGAAPFTWKRAPAPGVAFDYVLLLGVLFLAADLAYVETQFGLLGANWPYHLLLVSVLYTAAAYRWDSAVVLGLALSAFAAWRGVSVNFLHGSLGPARVAETHINAVVSGAAFVAVGVLLARRDRKAHFEDVYLNVGLLLLFGGLLSGVYASGPWGVWLLVLLAVALAVAWVAFREGRSLLFAEGVIAAYVGLLRAMFEPFRLRSSEAAFFLVVAASAAGVLGFVVAAHRRMRER
jgi:hypothetical protein